MSDSFDDEFDDYISNRPPWSAVLGLFMLITCAALGFAVFLHLRTPEAGEHSDTPVLGNVDMDALNRRFDGVDGSVQRHVEQNRQLLNDRSR